MTITQILRETVLNSLDAEVLLAHALGTSREWLITHRLDELSTQQLETWQACEARRLKHEPVAYITGSKEFYGRPFAVNRHTLIPRPATEGLIEAVRRYVCAPENSVTEIDTDIVAGCRVFRETKIVSQIIDVGTGSGCIAITLALELPSVSVLGSDISPEALTVAAENAKALGADVSWLEADGAAAFSNINTPFLVVSNPPYIPNSELLPPSVKDFEPHGALFSGPKGMNLMKTLVLAAKANPHCIGIWLECKAEQWKEVEKWT